MLKKFLNPEVVVGAVLLLVVLILLPIQIQNSRTTSQSDSISLQVSGMDVVAKPAKTPEEWGLGLMYVEELGEFEGMLFIAEADLQHGFWMKNTLIPLDMLFLDKERRIVDINKSAQPCVPDAPCPSFIPKEKYRYVLELNGGFSEKYDVEIGGQVQFEE